MEHLHPMVVHFPIALVLCGVLCDVLRAFGRLDSELMGRLGLWLTTAGVISILPAIGTGLLAHTFQAAPSPEVQDHINLHERLSYAVLLLLGTVQAWRWDSVMNRGIVAPRHYLIPTVLGALLLIVAASYGGDLVYRFGMGVDLDGASRLRAAPSAPSQP